MIAKEDYKLLNLIFEKKLVEEMINCGIVKNYSKGDIIVNYEDTLKNIPLVIDGILKKIKIQGKVCFIMFERVIPVLYQLIVLLVLKKAL